MFERIKSRLLHFLYLYIIRDRVAYARRLGASIGERCLFLCDPLECLGSEPYLLSMGNHVEITNGVHFITHEGALWVVREMEPKLRDADILLPIRIGNNVFIGNNAIILPGVTIGDNVVIGAGSIVTRDIMSNSVVAGVPAKVIETAEAFAEKAAAKTVPTKNMSKSDKKAYILGCLQKKEGKECNE